MVSSSASVIAGLLLVVGGADGGAGSQPDAATRDAGALTPEIVSATVRRHIPRVRDCYQQALLTNRMLATMIRVTWTIDTSGSVRGLKSTSMPGTPTEFVACVERTVAAWRFTPPPTAPVDVEFPFFFQSKDGPTPAASAANAPAARTLRPVAARASREGPAWDTARKWLAALGASNTDALAQLTSFPLTYKTYGMRRECANSPRDSAELKRWVACLRQKKSLITDELRQQDGPLGHDDNPDPKLVAAGETLSGGEWVSLFLNGDGVAFEFRVLVTTGEAARTVKAVLVSASFDQE